MNMRQSFKIEAWDSEEPFVPISHRHQLRGLQNILTRTKPNYQNIRKRELKITTKPDISNEDKSFLSLRSNRKKYYTEEIRRQPEPIDKQLINQLTPSQLDREVPPLKSKKKGLSTDCFHKTKEACVVFQNIMALIDRQPTVQAKSPKLALSHIKNLDAQIDKLKKRSRSFEHIFEAKKNEVKSLSNKYKSKKQNKVQVHSQECLVILPHLSKDQKLKELKSFFLKTIKGMEKNRLMAEQQEKEIRNNDYRWKKIVGKSHRNKKDLEDLFKTRAVFPRKQGEKANKVSKESVLQSKWKANPRQLSHMQGQFDDQSLYCPWYMRDDRVAQS